MGGARSGWEELGQDGRRLVKEWEESRSGMGGVRSGNGRS